MKVNYLCPFGAPSGVAQAAHDYCLALLAAGVELSIVPMLPFLPRDLEDGYEELLEHVATDWREVDPPAVWVIHAMPSDALDVQAKIPERAARVLVTTWETSHIPPAWVEPISKSFDGIVTPSEYSARAFRACTPRTAVVPHALRPLWSSLLRSYTERGHGHYTFYSVGAWGERKNLLGLIKAYWTEFSPSESVLLVIKTDRLDEVSLASLKLGTGLDELPAISVVTDRLKPEYMLALHDDCDCYVTASRGEGWNLGAFEACALAKPVIASGIGGHVDFLTDYEGWHKLVHCTLTPAVWTESMSIKHVEAAGQKFAIRSVERVAPKGIDGRQNWAQPDLRELQLRMRQAYAQQIGRASDSDYEFVCEGIRERFAQRYSYTNVGHRLADALRGFVRRTA